MTWGRKMRFFFSPEIKTKETKCVASVHTCAFCTFSTCVINILHFVECSWSVLSKTSGHLLFSELKFMRLSPISVLAMLERLQFYFILLPECWEHLCVSLCNEKSPCAMNEGKSTSDIYFCSFYIKLQNKCKTPRKTWLDDDADYNTRVNIFRDVPTCGDCQSSWVAFWKPKETATFSKEPNTPKIYFNKVSTFKSMAFI